MDPSKSTSNSQANTLPSTYDPTNIDSPGFDPETYVTKLLRESRLTQLVDKEQLLTKQIKTLDNEMQTLVYENYNKFISATDTIRQMKKDFKTMEDEMTRLISTMSTINSNNHQIHLTLDNRRQEIRKLTSIHVLLQKLQYLFQLPAKLKEYADDNQYDLAVNTYTKALKALQKYEHIPSFNHIQQTCKETMTNILIELRKSLTIIQTNEQIQSSPDHQQSQLNLSQCVDKMLKQLTNDIKSTFQNLSKFLDGTELVCYTGKKNVFMKQFATNHVWNGFFLTLLERLITYFEHEYTTASNHSTMIRHEQSSPPILLLILSKLILDFDSSSTPYLCTVFEEKFNFILENNQRGDNQKSGSSSFSIDRSKLTAVQKQFSVIAKQLLKQYICSQGFTLSQMLRKSIETRDWLNTVEPRHVRSVMKRIVEDLTQIDKQVKTLYNDQQSPAPLSSSYGRYYHRSNLVSGGARSSDGGRRTIIMPRSSALDRTTSGGPGSSAGSTGNLQLNFHKVFNEKLDIFIDLQFQKTSILSSIIKLLLKTYLECIRLKTFSRYGLQQVQVDINYLYNYLWSFVNNDDRFITNLLEEIVSSTAMRCLDPVLMEASVITVICEGN
ncbi:unnamed protein product [Rotaria magnacalcarata]|uniref:Vacuolar protein sorting-associated protein 51 homolog n=1 Tax=Rotaria magnacalcarata TaxID=392030 RepID=A0A8S2JUZ1_9BILA|nr:unnamed protein product [Rotaria magnacalcarata]